MEERMDDIRAVMDAAGSERAALLGVSEGGSLSLLFALHHADRARALILYGSWARRMTAPDYPWGIDAPQLESFLAAMGGPGTPASGGVIRRIRARSTTIVTAHGGPATSGWPRARRWLSR